ncbi:MAG: enoyl-CoA hydratase/isomerase family protein [Proteobacteria bacterium]|nr:enoyl-CoA hydratase/isomerase family protein [Pseudomonadota bacterium]
MDISQPPELQIDGALATLTLRRPQQANRLQPQDLDTVLAHLARVDAEHSVRVLCLRSSGRHFCSGYDIGSISAARTADFETMVNALEDARPLTVAVLQGGVYGGATDLALACDFRLGTPAVDLFMPAARLGLHFYRRGLERYVSRLGLEPAKRLFLTAQRLDAEELQRIGFLSRLVPAAELDGAAAELCAALAALAPLAVQGMKKHLNRIARGALDADDLQRDVARAAASHDLAEGRAAWAEKRAPRFEGR